jgi:hypothetical protein
VAVDVVRVELERGIEIGNGAGKIVREEPCLTASAEAAGIVGREPDRLAIVTMTLEPGDLIITGTPAGAPR